jgi:EAL domain-containing protein (putative c-di-GMP-specific phosphodiesterase class I)
MAKVPGLFKGLGVTFSTMVRTLTKGSNTVQYPHVKEAPPIRARGVIALHQDNCTSCMLCSRSCPDWCIYIEAHKEVAPRLIVELTETAALIDIEESMRFVSRIRTLGARVAIDDFGAGYTSFRNLQSLRVDMVKVDGTFVKDLADSRDNQIFVSTLVNLAKNFNLSTVAEWVGSERECDILRGYGVDYFQGIHYGAPSIAEPWDKPVT